MIISFITEQGGVGKSSLCYHLGWYLASQGKKVLFVDTDAQGANLSFMAGVKRKEEKDGINEILLGKKKIEDCIYRLTSNLSIIPANNNAMDIPSTVESLNYDIKCLKKVLARVKNRYDYIFIDTNPTPSVIHVISLVASNELIIPLVPDGKSIESTSHIIETYEGIKNTENKNLEIKAVVFNRYEKRSNLSKVVEEELKEICADKGLPLAQVKITQNTHIGETVLAKEGITDYAPKSKGAKCYIALAKELFGV